MRKKIEAYSYSLDSTIAEINDQIPQGWDVIQLTYGQDGPEGWYVIACTAVDKKAKYKRQFVKVSTFAQISGTKEVGVFFVDEIKYYVGVPS